VSRRSRGAGTKDWTESSGHYGQRTAVAEHRTAKAVQLHRTAEAVQRTAVQFHFWEYINGNQTFVMETHRPFVCSACKSPNYNARRLHGMK
jgi:hypothetical protein